MPALTLHQDHLYADPHVYDVLHDVGTVRDVRVLAKIAARCGTLPPPGQRLWLEPACGSGRFLLAIAAQRAWLGDRAIGFDQSPAMVQYANERANAAGARARVRCAVAEMEDFIQPLRLKPASVHIAFNPINSIRHLASDAAMLRHFRQMRDALAPGGVYIVGVSLVAYRWEQPTEDIWKAERAGLSVTQVVQFLPANPGVRGAWGRRERVVSHLAITHQGKAIDRTSRYWLRCYSKAQWLALLARSGFVIAGVADTDGDPREPTDSGYFLFALRAATNPRRA
jgi:SAM-dependent methyltransferase